jgi:tetratricopeptide (TPR) repeat protein
MARRIDLTRSGRQENVWYSEEGGALAAYDLTDWYWSLPDALRPRIGEVLQQCIYAGDCFERGPYEVHHPFLPQYAHQYSNVPPPLSGACQALWKKGDYEAAEVVLDEWIQRAIKENAMWSLFFAYCEAVELNWRKGYESGKAFREKGLYNQALLNVKDYALAVKEMLEQGIGRNDPRGAKAMDRLALLQKF